MSSLDHLVLNGVDGHFTVMRTRLMPNFKVVHALKAGVFQPQDQCHTCRLMGSLVV